jgi:hypothetical protein
MTTDRPDTTMSNSEQENVVRMESYGQLRRGLDSEREARVLQEAARLACDGLKALMERMMDKVDDALFERTEKAEHSALQTRYFDAMRELRLIRRDIEDAFVARLAAGFADGVPRNRGEDRGNPARCRNGHDLAPCDRDRLEEEIAIAGMVKKMRSNCAANLHSLDRRFGFLMHDPDLRFWHNPVGPEPICDAFHHAASQIQTGLEIRLVIFKLFDQHVGSQADGLYTGINHYLVSKGVLPNLSAVDGVPTPPMGAPAPADPAFPVNEAGSGPTRAGETDPDLSDIPMAAGIQPCYRNMVQLPDAASVPLAPGIQPCYRRAARFPDAASVPMADGIEPSRGVCTPMPATVTPAQETENPDAGPVAIPQEAGWSEVPEATAGDEIQHSNEDEDGFRFVREFVATHWKRLLFVTCARHGKDSEAWTQAVRTMNELIWSVRSTHTAENRRRLAAIQPRLLRNLRQGMERLLVPLAEREDFIARLVRAHNVEAAGGGATRAQQPYTEPQAPIALPAAAEPTPAASTAKAAGVQVLHGSDDRFEATARRLKPGDWVEFWSSDGTGRQAKLSWVSPITGTLLFTDREGLRAANHSIDELAHLLRCSRAQVLGSTPVTESPLAHYKQA